MQACRQTFATTYERTLIPRTYMQLLNAHTHIYTQCTYIHAAQRTYTHAADLKAPIIPNERILADGGLTSHSMRPGSHSEAPSCHACMHVTQPDATYCLECDYPECAHVYVSMHNVVTQRADTLTPAVVSCMRTCAGLHACMQPFQLINTRVTLSVHVQQL